MIGKSHCNVWLPQGSLRHTSQSTLHGRQRLLRKMCLKLLCAFLPPSLSPSLHMTGQWQTLVEYLESDLLEFTASHHDVIHVRCSTNRAVIRCHQCFDDQAVWRQLVRFCQPWWDLFLVLKEQLLGSCWLLVCYWSVIGQIGQVPALFCWRPWDPTCCCRPTRLSPGTVRKVLCSSWP